MPLRKAIIYLGSVIGLILITIGVMTPASLLVPTLELQPKIIDLNTTWQIPALIICSLVFGSKAGIIASSSYLTIGVFYLPIFHGGGSLGYLLTPNFSYLLGFIPSAWLIGHISETSSEKNILYFTSLAILGILIIHLTGIIGLIFGAIMSLWKINELFNLISLYTIIPIFKQIIMAAPAACISTFLHSIFIK